MSLRLPTRTLVPVLVLAVLGGIVATFMVARPPSSAGDDTPSLVRPKLAKPAPVKKPHPGEGEGARREGEARARAAREAEAREPAAPAVDANGLPRVLSTALAGNRVVVVGLHDPDSALDQMALAEARAGARAAGRASSRSTSSPRLSLGRSSSSAPWRTPGSSSTASPTCSSRG